MSDVCLHSMVFISNLLSGWRTMVPLFLSYVFLDATDPVECVMVMLWIGRGGGGAKLCTL